MGSLVSIFAASAQVLASYSSVVHDSSRLEDQSSTSCSPWRKCGAC